MKKYIFYYPSEKIGGAQLLMARAAEFLILQGYSVAVLNNSKNEECYIIKFLDSKGYNYSKECFSSEEKYLGKESEIMIIPQPTVFKLNMVLCDESKIRIFQ